jgi:hypothetical protein
VMNRRLAPDDDPRFDEWVRNAGPLQDLPPITHFSIHRRVAGPILAAAALLVGLIALSLAIGIALAFAIGAEAGPIVGAVFMVVGTVLAGGGAIALVVRKL